MEEQQNMFVDEKQVVLSALLDIGRLGSQMMYYFFGKVYAETNEMQLILPEWKACEWFVLSQAPQCLLDIVTDELPEHLPIVIQADTATPFQCSDVFAQGKIFFDIDKSYLDSSMKPRIPYNKFNLIGFFLYHTKYYSKSKKLFLDLFKFQEDKLSKLEEVKRVLMSGTQRDLLCIHIRTEDYITVQILPNTQFKVISFQVYLDWLAVVWPKLHKPILYISTTDPQAIHDIFSQYHPVTSHDIVTLLSKINANSAKFWSWPQNRVYLDFYMLTQANYLAISNSCFSMTSSLLAKNAKCYRPCVLKDTLAEFDPWNDDFLKIWPVGRLTRWHHIRYQYGWQTACEALARHLLFYLCNAFYKITRRSVIWKQYGMYY